MLSENEFFCGFKPVTEWSSEGAVCDSKENDYRLKTILMFLNNWDAFYNDILKSNSEKIIDSTAVSFVSACLLSSFEELTNVLFKLENLEA